MTGEGFLPREQRRLYPEVHVAGVCIRWWLCRRDYLILLARRSTNRELFPGFYEGCGGQLAPGETFQDGVARHFREELGLEIRVLTEPHCFYEIRQPNEPLIPGIRFLCQQIGSDSPKLTNHSEYVWTTDAGLRAMPAGELVGSMKHEVLELLERHRRLRRAGLS